MLNEPKKKLSIILFSGDFDKIHYGLVTASASAAINIPVTLFFTMAATKSLVKGPNNQWWEISGGKTFGSKKTAREINQLYEEQKIANFEELLNACVTMKVKFMICEMGLRALNIESSDLRNNIPIKIGGIVSFLEDNCFQSQIIFI